MPNSNKTECYFCGKTFLKNNMQLGSGLFGNTVYACKHCVNKSIKSGLVKRLTNSNLK